MFLDDSEFEKVIRGNIKKNTAKRSINIQFTEDEIDELEMRSMEEEIPRNKYISIALEHYWNCDNIE